jgi:hypothetical protein
MKGVRHARQEIHRPVDRSGAPTAQRHCHQGHLGHQETLFALWQAPSPAGPWTRAISQTNQSWRRRIVADVRPLDGPAHFAILQESPERALAAQIVEHLLGLRPSDPSFDTNADTRIDVADIAKQLAPASAR